MAQYYGVTRTNEYLMHHGVKGMRWGARKQRKTLSKSNKNALLAIANGKVKPVKDRRPWLTRLLVDRQDLKDASKAAVLSLFMGPSAAMYVQSRRAVADPPKAHHHKRRR